jgi:asparagine synthase (glutamine-hydrolysing)
MCSISGIINDTGVEKMIAVQKHRAPDESGVYRDQFIELGMGRLKIIDLVSPGLAPYQEDNFILAYNGEIYNHIELRKELEEYGWVFRTTSDTEVLMKAFRQWDVKMFDHLNGMFAIALYDNKKRRLILARDIAGEKPLYYTKRDKKFYFASEAKALQAVLPLEEESCHFFDAFQHCHTTTIWKNVHEIPAAHYLEYDLAQSQMKLHEYWQFRPRTINPKTAVEELEALLEDAVKIRTRSDVPIGLYYSKGIDSSLIGTMFPFAHQFYFDDTQNWNEDFLKHIDKVAYHLDFPVGSLSSYPLWKLAEEASKKVKVVLSGEGADEIFGGYVRYLPLARQWELEKQYPSYGYLFGKHYPSYVDAFAKITARGDNVEFVKEQIRPYFDQFPDPINAMGFADFKLVMPSLLQMGDRMSSAFGMENRCPFLDRRVIEFGFSLPPELKIQGFDQKIMLRKILQKRGVLEPLSMEKKGLTIQFNKWLGKSDWDRSHYFDLLKDKWAGHYHPKKKGIKQK